MARDSTKEDSNKALVQASFDRWKSGTGGPFELLAPDAEWTIVGSSLGSSERPIRIIRDYRVLSLPLHLRKRGRSVLPNMMQVMNAVTPFIKQPRRSPTPAS
jgi:ketosteroid isomerase-like protein